MHCLSDVNSTKGITSDALLKGQLQRFDKLSLSDRLRHVENGFNINF